MFQHQELATACQELDQQMDSSLKQRQDENAEYKEAGHLRYRCTRLYSWSHHVGDFNWNMSREMFVGCVDVTAHCKPVHKVHP